MWTESLFSRTVSRPSTEYKFSWYKSRSVQSFSGYRTFSVQSTAAVLSGIASSSLRFTESVSMRDVRCATNFWPHPSLPPSLHLSPPHPPTPLYLSVSRSEDAFAQAGGTGRHSQGKAGSIVAGSRSKSRNECSLTVWKRVDLTKSVDEVVFQMSQFPHKSVSLFFMLAITKDEFTDLWGN